MVAGAATMGSYMNDAMRQPAMTATKRHRPVMLETRAIMVNPFQEFPAI